VVILSILATDVFQTKRGKHIQECYGPVIIPLLIKLQFLIDLYGFKKPKIDMARHEVWVIFTKPGFKIYFEYEIYNYPYGYIEVIKDGKNDKILFAKVVPLSKEQKESKLPIQVDAVIARYDQFIKVLIITLDSWKAK
jgi:hypothetical protein